MQPSFHLFAFLLPLLFVCLMLLFFFFFYCPPLSLSLSRLSAFLCFFLCVLSSRHVAFQERRVTMRLPISSVVLPQAAVAPPLAELRCDWPHNDSLARLPVKRLSQFMLPNGDLTVYQKKTTTVFLKDYRRKKKQKCMQLVVHFHWFIHVSL